MSGVEKAILHGTTWLMAITGSIFFWMKYVMKRSDPFSAVHHPWQPHVLSLHVIGGPLAVFALGWIFRDHILGSLLEPRRRTGRATGIVIVALAAPMIASGYMMQVLTDPASRRILVWVHVASGILYTGLFAAHLVASRRARAKGNGNGRAHARARPSRARVA